MCQVAPIGSSGGLVLSWRPGVDLDCFLSNKNHIAAWCLSDPAHSPWILSCIYGPPALREKPAFWDSITSVSDHFDCPWLCIGDLNFVLDQTEKQGGRRVASSSSCPFKSLLIIQAWWTSGLQETLLPGATKDKALLLSKRD
jgi:hypothetical protein